MERLTKRNESNTAYYYPKCFEKCDGLGLSMACNRYELQHDMCEKLGHYEDLEEQGLLLKLPCKVGDILWTNHRMQGWYFRSKDAPYRVQVAFIGLNDSEEMGGGLFNVCYENHGYMMQFNFSDIGKTVFLIREEAEEALKIAGGENVLV